MWFVGTIAKGLHSIFVNRGGTEAERNMIVQTIMDRQRTIEDSGIKFNPICIFAEGTTTGGNHLLKFKRGAFQAMRTIQPCYVKFKYLFVRPTFDVIGLIDIIVLLFCNISPCLATLYIMPPFVPNQYMLDTHSDKGDYDWEIYAWCLRQAMAKSGGFTTCDMTIREKLNYEHFMLKDQDSCSHQGKTYYAHDSEVGGTEIETPLL